MFLGIVLIVLSILLLSIISLDRYLSAKSYDPLGLGPTAIKVKGTELGEARWIAVPDDFIYQPGLTGNYYTDILGSIDGELVGRGRTARSAVADMVRRHVEKAEEIDLTY